MSFCYDVDEMSEAHNSCLLVYQPAYGKIDFTIHHLLKVKESINDFKGGSSVLINVFSGIAIPAKISSQPMGFRFKYNH